MSVSVEKHLLGDQFKKRALMHQDTYDLPHLNLYDEHPVFLYGTLKSNFPRNVVCDAGTMICEASTTEKMMMFKRAVGEGYPVIFNDLQNPLPKPCEPYVATVKGELWHVPTDVLVEMDSIEGNPTVYQRIPLEIQLMSKPVTPSEYQLFQVVKAWGYVGNKDFWREDADTSRITPIKPVNHQLEFTKAMHYVQM